MPALTEALASYVPALIARRLAVNPTPISAPSAETFPAAVLFADISGLTFLVEHLVRDRLAGTEELSRTLNDYFGQLIELIAEHGGDTVKFSGNALLAIWPARAGLAPDVEEDLGMATQRATQCAQMIQQQLHAYQTAPDIRLSLRLAVGTGRVLAVQLGGVYKRWEFLVTGKPITEVVLAGRYAQPGEIIITSQAWALVQNGCTGQPTTAKNVRLKSIHHRLPPRPSPILDLPPAAAAGLEAYMPGAVVARLAAGQPGWLAELRRVTVLFINLPDLNDSTPLDQTQTITRTLQRALYRYEGSINKLSVDDRGVTLVAALGLPPLAHKDDAVRGVQAALAIQVKLQELQLRGAIGLATGRAFCGSIGNKRRCEYTMIGAVVNLAERLMEAATAPPRREGEREQVPILCDEATFQAAQISLTFEALPSIKIKGKTDPVDLYRPLVKHEIVSHPRPRMVGRSGEKAALIEGLQGLLRGKSKTVVIIEGDAGLGKSRLVEELLRQAETLNIDKVLGAGNPIQKSVPYHAWQPIFKQLLAVDSPVTEEQRQQVLAKLEEQPSLSRFAPLLNTILHLKLPDNDLTGQMTGKVRADNTHDLMIFLLQTWVSQSPRLLVIEDAHWLDSASWALLQLVSREVQPLFLVITTQPILDSKLSGYGHLIETPDTRHLRLEALPLQNTLALVRQHLGVRSLPDAVINLIQEKTGGNPFFSQELACALHDAGLIEISGAYCHLTVSQSELRSQGFSRSIEDVITHRIEHLSPQQQLTLKTASVIGHIFAFRILHDIYPMQVDKPHLRDYLATLEALGLIQVVTSVPDLIFGFRHVIIQEAAYKLLALPHRQKLQKTVATWYERIYAADLSPFYPRLAHHWSQVVTAGDEETELLTKTIDFLEKAGEQAWQQGAYQEAADYVSRILEFAARSEFDEDRLRKASWERHLGEAYDGLGVLTENCKHYKQALTLLGRPFPDTAYKMGKSLLSQAARQLLHTLFPDKFLGHLPDAPVSIQEAIRVYGRLGRIYLLKEEKFPLVYATLRAVNLAERIAPSHELVLGYGRLSLICAQFLFQTAARTYSRRAHEIAKSVNNLAAQAVAERDTGSYLLGMGQWLEAQKRLEQASEISNSLGDRRLWEESQALLAMIAYHQGQFGPSARLFADVFTSAQHRDEPQSQLWGLLGQVENQLRLGGDHMDRAMSLLKTVQGMLSETLLAAEKIRASGVLAAAHLRRNELGLAQQAAQTAAQFIAQSSFMVHSSLEGYAGPADLYLTLWETSGSKLPADRKTLAKSARQACQALRKFARIFPIGQPRALLGQGRYEWLSGRPRKAHKTWQKSLAQAKRLEMLYEQGLAHYEIGRHLPIDDPAQREHLKNARKIFTKLEARYDLIRTQHALIVE